MNESRLDRLEMAYRRVLTRAMRIQATQAIHGRKLDAILAAVEDLKCKTGPR